MYIFIINGGKGIKKASQIGVLERLLKNKILFYTKWPSNGVLKEKNVKNICVCRFIFLKLFIL